MHGVMALGRELLSSSKVLLVLAFYHFLSAECSSIQYYYDDTSFYSDPKTALLSSTSFPW